MLTRIVDQTLNDDCQLDCDNIRCVKCRGEGDEERKTQSNCKDCWERVTLIAKSMKDISSSSVERDGDSNVSDHQTRSKVIDALLQSHSFSLETRQTSLSAKKWLESIRQATNVKGSSDVDEFDQSLDGTDLRARLQTTENMLSSKLQEISNLKSEIGRLESSSRSQVCLVLYRRLRIYHPL